MLAPRIYHSLDSLVGIVTSQSAVLTVGIRLVTTELVRLGGISLDHSRTQAVPVGEEHIGGDGVQIGEKVFAGGQDGTGLLSQLFHAIAHRVKGKRQQIQEDKQLRQVLFAVPEVVLQMIAMVLQHVEALVFDLPTGAGAGHDLGHILRVDCQAGHEGAAIGHLAGQIHDFDTEPVRVERVFAIAQRHVLDPMVAVRPRTAAHAAFAHRMPLGLGAAQKLVERLMAIFFAFK